MKFYHLILLAFSLLSCNSPNNSNLEMATNTLDSIYKYYSNAENVLLKENYPIDKNYSASYLASEDGNTNTNRYAYLWPYSGTLSAVSALIEAGNKKRHKEILENKVLKGLENYFDSSRIPYAYSSYINSKNQSDRFYDDNIWLGIDFVDLYLLNGTQEYLSKAKLIWEFIESGSDSKLGGGIYWCEQKKASKNTCSNAPAAVLAFKLYKATGNQYYLTQGKALYNWTKSHLQDEKDGLYFDNINLEGNISKAKYAYNSGQMLQAAAMLYQLTGDSLYIIEAKKIASSCYDEFFYQSVNKNGENTVLLKNRDIWFSAVMLRGYLELFKIDGNKKYLDTINQSLQIAWEKGRDKNGFFGDDLTQFDEKKKWLLTQLAMVEMYARLSLVY